MSRVLRKWPARFLGEGAAVTPFSLTRPFRRGYRFGTLLVNLESRRVVDLLPDRLAETVIEWMKQHPDIAVVSRDRGSDYTKAATVGAPQAIQCADRFHIVQNLTEALQLLLARCQADVLAANSPALSSNGSTNEALPIEEWRAKEPAYAEEARLARRAGKYAHYQQVVAYAKQGVTAKEIARRMDLSERTVQRWLAAGAFPEARKRRKRHNCFDEFAPYVLKRWQDGERNGLTLLNELREHGYTGSQSTLYRYLEPLKQAEIRSHVFLASGKFFAPLSSYILYKLNKDFFNRLGLLAAIARRTSRHLGESWSFLALPRIPCSFHRISRRFP